MLWGTLWDLALLYTLLTHGPSAASQAVLAPPLQNAAAAWANRLSGLLAVFAWAFAIGALLVLPAQGRVIASRSWSLWP